MLEDGREDRGVRGRTIWVGVFTVWRLRFIRAFCALVLLAFLVLLIRRNRKFQIRGLFLCRLFAIFYLFLISQSNRLLLLHVIIPAKTNSCFRVRVRVRGRARAWIGICTCIPLSKIITLRLISRNSSLRGLAPPKNGSALACFARDEMRPFLKLVLASGGRGSRVGGGGSISISSSIIISCCCSGIHIFLRNSSKRRRRNWSQRVRWLAGDMLATNAGEK